MANSAYGLTSSRNNVDAVGTKNGVNTTFTIPYSESYDPASLEVYINGQLYQPTSITKNGPGYTTFTITGDTIPGSTDSLTVSYVIN